MSPERQRDGKPSGRPRARAAKRHSDAGDLAQRPLDFSIIRRLYACTQPYVRLRTMLLVLVVLRSLQLPTIAWLTARVISGPIAAHDASGIALGALAFLG